MKYIMIKKILKDGKICEKCRQTEELLEKRGLLDKINSFVMADENDPLSEGMKLAEKHGVKLAPFFIAETEDGTETIYTSALQFIKKELSGESVSTTVTADFSIPEALKNLEGKDPDDIIRYALEHFGSECAIAFSGAEDIVLIDLAIKTALPFSVFCLDTGRLHPETYRFIDTVRKHYGIDIQLMNPDPVSLEPFVKEKGLFSFYDDGHKECCGIRKVEPLKRILSRQLAWISGQRRDQSPSTRGDIPLVQEDPAFSGKNGLIKFNPLANWSSGKVWEYIRYNDVPYNELHDRGFISIGCEPCTRPCRPGEHERAGRWWWEEETKRECGLHIGGKS